MPSKSDRRSSSGDQESTMTKHAKMLCSLAMAATALVTFSLSSSEAFARYGVVRRVAATHASHSVNNARVSPFVRGKLNPYAANSLRRSASLNRQNLTERKGHNGDKDKHGDKGHGHDRDKDKYGDKDHGHDRDKDKYGDKGHGHDRDKD